jgi:hypothetical protein
MTAPDEAALLERLQGRMLFVLGHARSGTTITLNVLNAARDIYLFGEANAHVRWGQPGFPDTFNAQHVDYGNQHAKASYAPPHIAPGATVLDAFVALARSHRIVGEKIAFAGPTIRDDIALFERVLLSRFFDARYVFTMRAPTPCTISHITLFGNHTPLILLQSYTVLTGKLIDLARVLPNVELVFAEEPPATTLARLEAISGSDLSGCEGYLTERRIRPADRSVLPADVLGIVDALEALYPEIAAGWADPRERRLLQIEEKFAAKDGFETRFGRVRAGLLAIEAEIAALLAAPPSPSPSPAEPAA